MSRDYRFWRRCDQFSDREEIGLLNKMVEDGEQITRRTFQRHTKGLRGLEWHLGYERRSTQGLTMANDYHVSYYRSRYNGERVYFFRHSAYEYIFTFNGGGMS